ncbi:MAG TPA: HpcH/HpaI aldolase/citrate lyase family protein [Verrucomicrobiae bacterium]|nr:HpcH/HpaI aldolase/citrate lyase family protein [Verrucomicrobiae bacterium]
MQTSLPANSFRRALREGRPLIGFWSSLCSNLSVEILAGAGFDWLLLDMEHAPNEVPLLISQLQAMTGGTAAPVVRPAWNDLVLIKRVLDAGAQNLLVPYIQTADEARAAVAATRYPPEGLRGVATAHRSNRFGRTKDYFQRANGEMCVVAQVETRSTLQNLESIAAVEGVDGLFIGPSDLSASLGHPGNPRHPDVRAAIEDAGKRIRKAGKVVGILTPVEEDARHWLAQGFTVLAVGGDATLLARQSEELAAKFKNLSGQAPKSGAP